MTALEDVVRRARTAGDPQQLADAIPYNGLIGAEMYLEEGELRFRLQFREGNIGNPLLPALHGGVVGAFMENAAVLHLLWTQESTRVPKVVDFSIDYLRPGRPEDLYARCLVRRQGRRVANVSVTSWQAGGRGGRERIVAHARTHFLLRG
jgi:uncharacterized protein (TIGR00369 family)